MDESTDWALELLIAIVVIAMVSPFFFKSATYMLSSDFGGFDTEIVEKTALRTSEELFPNKRIIDRDDEIGRASCRERV